MNNIHEMIEDVRAGLEREGLFPGGKYYVREHGESVSACCLPSLDEANRGRAMFAVTLNGAVDRSAAAIVAEANERIRKEDAEFLNSAAEKAEA